MIGIFNENEVQIIDNTLCLTKEQFSRLYYLSAFTYNTMSCSMGDIVSGCICTYLGMQVVLIDGGWKHIYHKGPIEDKQLEEVLKSKGV